MRYMLDTNICIYAIKQKPEQVLRRMKSHMSQGVCISTITLAELAHGIVKSKYPGKNGLALMQLLAVLEVLPFDNQAALTYGTICASLQSKGTPIGTMDMLIAAHAKSQNLTLVTNNAREFVRVEDLRVENWTEKG